MMRGLVLKDIYLLVNYCRSYFFIAIVFVALAFFQTYSVFFLIYPILISSLIPMTLLSYDEKDKWDRYSAVLPYTRAQIVSAKYFTGMILNIAVFLITAAVQAVKLVHNGAFEFGPYLDLCEMLFSLGLLAPAVVLPFVFKLGAEKGRIAYYLSIGIICGVSVFLTVSELNIPGLINFKLNQFIVFIFAMALYVISWKLSIKFYSDREL